MDYQLHLRACAKGTSLPLLPLPPLSPLSPLSPVDGQACAWQGHWLACVVQPSLPLWPVGSVLCDERGKELLQVSAYSRLQRPGTPHFFTCPCLTACADITADHVQTLNLAKKGRSLAWITLSDKGAQGLREDKSGPAIAAMLAEKLPLCHVRGFMLADDAAQLRALLTELALVAGYDLICTTGGTGLSPRDIAPQVTASLLDLPLNGFVQAMLAASLSKTPHAAISRAAAGVLGRSIIINLPGSHRAVEENLAALLPCLPHALDKLHGDPADCGG